MDQSQIKGVAIIAFSLIGYSLLDNTIMHTISGILCAVGLGLILKWIPFSKKNTNQKTE
ncbi:hypothetical protein [Patiriisocius marinus]|uniref:Uncharacterized protein n=1 Tax=Patiriisocius marinus TaxID=1397112 RepID=A0A5J4J0K2_9FLAO|nr:hypothetical protein [Patiriisocius marinus]GER59303.1 hypothetical protein ULMA_14110 [Patiriisocius marinus]